MNAPEFSKLKALKADLLVIGAGPAGLFAALQCKGLKTIVLEKNPVAGKKLLISGSGRCNLTHEGEISDFAIHYGDHARFLKTSLYQFQNKNLLAFFHSAGLETMVDKNGKIFPATQKASDVLQVLLSECKNAGVEIAFNQHVANVTVENGIFFVTTSTGKFSSRFLLIATGGMSYPATGSTGDGYHFAKAAGHTIVPPKPSLSPIFIKNYAFAGLAGISVDNAEISIYREGRKFATHTGDIGFTHKGLSGPGILDFSRNILAGDILRINFTGVRVDELRNGLISAAASAGNTQIAGFFRKSGLPRSLVLALLSEAHVPYDLNLASLTKSQRNAVLEVFCESPFEVSKTGGFNMAMVTAGGVSLGQIDRTTMQSKLVEGLYFAGEVLDIDGDTGGYNLQAAFSTAYSAAQHIIRQFSVGSK